MNRSSRFLITCALPFIWAAFLFMACGGSKQVVQDVPEPEPVVVVEPEEEIVEPVVKPPVVAEPKVPLILNRIHFDFDRYDIRLDAMQTLKENASVLQAHKDAKITIEGHCDERGTIEYNLLLGDRRAKATRDYLVAQGVEARRISVISYGKDRPLDSRRNENAYAMNRRSDFLVKKEVASN